MLAIDISPAVQRPGRFRPATRGTATIRAAEPGDAAALHALIRMGSEIGHLLPRSPEDVNRHLPRFLVLSDGAEAVGCAELAILSRQTAEIRSLIVRPTHRKRGLGGWLLTELGAWAARERFARLCAFTHDPRPFFRLGFSLVPHRWLPEKIATDCWQCPRFRVCGQHAVVRSVVGTSGSAPGGAVGSSVS